jgi:hypothetical protein
MVARLVTLERISEADDVSAPSSDRRSVADAPIAPGAPRLSVLEQWPAHCAKAMGESSWAGQGRWSWCVGTSSATFVPVRGSDAAGEESVSTDLMAE